MQHVMHLNSDAWPPLGAPPPQNGRHLQGAMQTPTALPEPAASKSGPSLGFYNVWNGRSSDVWTPSPGLHPSLPSKPLPASFISASAFAASDPTRMPEQGAFAHLDRFAPIYVPLWMRQIAAAEPACIVKHPDQPIQNGHAFAKAIFPKTLYEAIREERLVAEKSVLSTINLELEKLEKLDNSHIEPRYASKLFSLQIKEFEARKLDLVASTLYNVEVSRATLDDGGPYNLLKLEAPEIREGYPMLDVNDIVFLRHLRNSPQGVTWDGIVYLATVRNIKRSQAMVLIQCNPLNEVVSDTPERFIVGFEPQGRPYYAAREGLVSVQHHLRQESTMSIEPHLAHSWLFPSLSDYLKPMPPHNDPPLLPPNLEWIDSQLNTEQRRAVASLTYYRRIIPYLVSGPPGTGKTKTIVESVLQILKAYPSSSILLCGASNPSTDTLASRLSAYLGPAEMFRLNDESRPLDEVSGRLLPYCRIVGNRFGIPDFATLRKYKVLVTSTLDASVLSKFMFTNDNLARLEHSILSHWQPEAYKPLHYHFDYFICDEAGQLTEQDILPAVSVMLPSAATRTDHNHRTRRLPQICLVGDFQQLGPFVTSPEARAAELDVSLLQRLFERPLYKNHPGSRQNLGPRLLGTEASTVDLAEASTINIKDLTSPLCNLMKNYRSHIGLLMVPSASFYNDTLQPCAPRSIQETPMLQWPLLTSRSIPLMLWHVDGTEDMVDEGSSWFNEQELTVVIKCVKSLLKESPKFAANAPLKASDISIISPFREQVWKIRIKLRTMGLGEVNVGRESDMQGAENRVVIISTVRTSHRFVADDRRRNRGLIFEPKRFNVAVTRSKELLIIVGHVTTLHVDPFWRALVQLGVRHGCCRGMDTQNLAHLQDAVLGVGALEELFMQQQPAETEDVRPIAGSVAHAALREDGVA